MSRKLTTEDLFAPQGVQILPKQPQTIYVVVAKPTRVCNANCTYCSSPPLEEMGESWEPEWSFDTFKLYFDKVFPHMGNGAIWIWHGGEPMLMGHKFYRQCYEYALEHMKRENRYIYFSMQTNMLGYNDKWKDIFHDIFGGSLSTSFDPDETNRTIKGNWENYSRIFKSSLDKVINDGIRPMVIGVYKEENAHLMHKVYDWSKSRGENAFPVRFNYCVPTGRQGNTGELISPITYGNTLVEVYNRWIKDAPDFTITPLDQMFKKVIGQDGEGHCPWTRRCGGRFLAIEPNGDVYNCTDFADLDPKYRFGNLAKDSVEDMLNSQPSIQIRRRKNQVPSSCMACEHFDDCEGGCARDSVLYNNGMYGKFYYCHSWKIVFSRIKESILTGEADEIIKKFGEDPAKVKKFVKANIDNHFSDFEVDWETFDTNGLTHRFGFADNLKGISNAYDDNGQCKLGAEDLPEFKFEDPALIKKLKINDKLSGIKVKVE
jgi:radical SAM protein with 4Fe4S-binding SPASM domain